MTTVNYDPSRTPEEIYNKAIARVTLLDTLLVSTAFTDIEKRYPVNNHVQHLQILHDLDIWTSQDLDPIVDAIQRGNTFLGGL